MYASFFATCRRRLGGISFCLRRTKFRRNDHATVSHGVPLFCFYTSQNVKGPFGRSKQSRRAPREPTKAAIRSVAAPLTLKLGPDVSEELSAMQGDPILAIPVASD